MTELQKHFKADQFRAVWGWGTETTVMGFWDGVPVGVVNVKIDTARLEGYIWNLNVRQDYRGRGIGSRLLEIVERIVWDEKSEALLDVDADNERLRQWYIRKGYGITGERHLGYIRMKKRLV